MPFCERCGGSIEPGSKFCDNCGVPINDPPTPRIIQPPTNQEPPVAYQSPPGVAPMTGIANKFVGGFPLYTIIGVCGVALLILSFIIVPYPRIGSYLFDLIPVVFDYGRPDAILVCSIPIIGTACGIIGLLLHSWKVQIIAGLLLLITPILFTIFDFFLLPIGAFFILGGFLLVIAGFMMRTAASSATRA